MRQTVTCAPVEEGGLNMMNVKNLVHGLCVKWFHRICTDCGSSWSKFIWSDLTALILHPLLQGLQSVSKSILKQLPPFYTGIVRSYAHVNNLYYNSIDTHTLPQNLWCGKLFSHVDWDWIAVGYYTIADLLKSEGKIDVIAVKAKLQSVGYFHSPYLQCCAFQTGFSSWLGSEVVGTFVPNDLLPLVMMHVLHSETSQILDLNNWCWFFSIVPLEVPECKHIFYRMLVSCKITKFRTINLKILACILATLKIIAGIRKADNLRWCV